MIVLPQLVRVKWHPNNRENYEKFGYKFTKYRDEFLVYVTHLPKTAQTKINLICDYCEEEFPKRYTHYIKTKTKDFISKDCCEKCKVVKSRDTLIEKHGVENPMHVDGAVDNLMFTMNERYGVDNYSQTEEYHEKCKQTSLKNWGTEHPMQNNDHLHRVQQSNVEKYGYPCTLQHPEIKEKAVLSMYNNDTCKSSSQQREIHDMLMNAGYDVHLNYPVSTCSLDIALFVNGFKVNIEYDCYFWHSDKQQRDRRRDEFLKSQGWKIFRIKSSKKVPSIDSILSPINKLINLDYTYVQLVLDDWGIDTDNLISNTN
jgi:very-short-patch-repair endonuclease